jgi:hypothetical protein
VDGLAAQRRYERAARRKSSDAYVSCSRQLFDAKQSVASFAARATRPFSAGNPAIGAKHRSRTS